jgi:hypothetical protein
MVAERCGQREGRVDVGQLAYGETRSTVPVQSPCPAVQITF